jgi:hypothetical protein
MRAVTVVPLEKDSVDLTDLREPPEADGPVLVQVRAVGVCGTDLEIINGDYGWAPPGEARLAIGHESLGEVLQAPDGSDLAEGDLVVGIGAAPTRCPAPTAPWTSGTCAATASTPSGAPRNIMATPGNGTGFRPSSQSGWTPSLVTSGCSSSRPPWWPRHGCQNGVPSSGLWFSELAGDLHAARSYSLISPPRTLRRWMSAVAGPVIVAEMFSSQSGGLRLLARCRR